MSDKKEKTRVDCARVREAETLLKEYKRGKSALEHRIVDNEQWFRMHHDVSRSATEPANAGGWLFNAIANKHADAMDNYPEPVILPREQGDVRDAKLLSSVIPAILERCNFRDVYSDSWWYKLKHGASCYGVFWSNEPEGGDVVVRQIDLLNLFWEPGVTDLQKSRNVFAVELVDRDLLMQRYPVLRDRLGTPSVEITRYLYDDSIDTSGKAAVVDWYYKKDGVLHYCKFCAGQPLYASENEPALKTRGFYDHGQYPFVMDVMYPICGSVAGFGLVDVMREAQTYVDRMNAAMLKNALMASRKRFFIRADGSVNEEEFADFTRDFVHVMGSNLGEDSIREIETRPLDEIYVALLNNKIAEIKEISGNRDFSQGGTSGGVTAASAIAALQEAGSKLSRDMIQGGYRAFSRICMLIVELIRQFYDEPRVFRISGGAGEQFVPFDNSGIRPTIQGGAFGQDTWRRVPVFDIRISAARANPFSRVSQNELACEFFRLGLFDPNRANEALSCLSMMDFEGRDEVMRRIRENAAAQALQAAAAAAVQTASIPGAQGYVHSPDTETRVRSAQGSSV